MMNNTRKGLSWVELAAVIMLIGVSGAFTAWRVSSSVNSLRANDVIRNVNNIMQAAHDISVELDKSKLAEAQLKMKGCSVVKRDGAWYLVCDLDEMTSGNDMEEEFIRSRFKRAHYQDGLELEEDDYTMSIFLRFSSMKQELPEHSSEAFVNVIDPASMEYKKD